MILSQFMLIINENNSLDFVQIRLGFFDLSFKNMFYNYYSIPL